MWSYSYDNLNRLAGGSALSGYYQGALPTWTYDPFGNRKTETWGGSGSGLVPTSSTTNYTTASNQVTSSSLGNLTYDAAGDVMADGLNSYLYDAEGRLCAARNSSGVMTGYIYDAAGTRVAKGALTSFSCNFAPSNFTVTTSWVLGPGGEQVTEYSVTGGTSTWKHTNVFAGGRLLATYNGSNTIFAFNDWLGSKRAELSAGSSPCAAQFRSLPFGNGQSSPVALGSFPLCQDATEQHFTGKERDTESGNDYFGARYYSSSMGRWLSPDPVFLALNRLVNPQRWNLYGYALNSPFRYIDPDGEDAIMVVFPKFRAEAGGRRFPTGHGAMIVVDKNGRTTYREYGRYNPSGQLGRTRSVTVPNLKMDKEGHPTDESMKNLLAALSHDNQDGPVEALYFDEDADMDTALLKELQRRKGENDDPNREGYSLRNHNCGTLFCETMNAAGNHMPPAPWYSTPKDLFRYYAEFYPWWTFTYFYQDHQVEKTRKLREVVTFRIFY